MRLATVRTTSGDTRAVRVEGDALIDLGAPDVGAWLASGGTVGAPVAAAGFAPVIPHPGKIICVGLNYRNHILEMGRELPSYPTLFAKYPEALIGAYDEIALPPESDAVDWEPGGVRPALELTGTVDGEVVQRANTSDLVFDPVALVEYISTILTLKPGDVIASGTPGGVGHARKPARYLADGSVLVTEIEGLGRSEVKAAAC